MPFNESLPELFDRGLTGRQADSLGLVPLPNLVGIPASPRFDSPVG